MLKFLPLMYWLELLEIMFFVKCIQQPADNFDITQYIKFTTKNASSRKTPSITSNKLIHNVSHYNEYHPLLPYSKALECAAHY